MPPFFARLPLLAALSSSFSTLTSSDWLSVMLVSRIVSSLAAVQSCYDRPPPPFSRNALTIDRYRVTCLFGSESGRLGTLLGPVVPRGLFSLFFSFLIFFCNFPELWYALKFVRGVRTPIRLRLPQLIAYAWCALANKIYLFFPSIVFPLHTICRCSCLFCCRNALHLRAPPPEFGPLLNKTTSPLFFVP